MVKRLHDSEYGPPLLLVQRFPADGEIHGSEQLRLAAFDEPNPRRLERIDDL